MKPPYAIGSVSSLSGRAIAYRWHSLPRVRWHRASKPQGSSERVLPWQITMDQLIFASLSHTHYWYEVVQSISCGSDFRPSPACSNYSLFSTGSNTWTRKTNERTAGNWRDGTVLMEKRVSPPGQHEIGDLGKSSRPGWLLPDEQSGAARPLLMGRLEVHPTLLTQRGISSRTLENIPTRTPYPWSYSFRVTIKRQISRGRNLREMSRKDVAETCLVVLHPSLFSPDYDKRLERERSLPTPKRPTILSPSAKRHCAET